MPTVKKTAAKRDANGRFVAAVKPKKKGTES
jgi:hypothetical protein